MKTVFRLAMVSVGAAALVLLCYTMLRCLPGGISGSNGQCRYDLDSLRKADTNQLVAAGIKYVKPAIPGMTSLAVDSSGNIIVGSKTGIEILDTGGARRSRFGVSEPVYCLAVAPGGDILAGLKDHIEVYSSDGIRRAVWKSPDPKADLTSIAVAADRVFAADCVNRIVWSFSLSGERLGRIGDRDKDKRRHGFIVPSAFFDVAVAADGTLWVANPGEHRLEHFTADGRFLGCWGKASMEADGFCGCCNPSNFAIMPDGSFVTSEKHIVRVKIYDAAGIFKGIISGQEQWDKDAVGLDLAVDSKGRVLVLDPQAEVVRIYAGK